MAGRLPEVCDAAMPPPISLIESEMIPTDAPAPVAPSARAWGPSIAASPCEMTLPASTRAMVETIACVAPSAAAAASASAGRYPSTMRSGALSDTALTRMPSARSSSAARATSPVT